MSTTASLSAAGQTCWPAPSVIPLRNGPPSVFHQRHVGRVLRSSCRFHGRRIAPLLGREPRPRRRPPLWPCDVRNDGGSVAGAGADGSEARLDAALDGTLRPDDRRGKEVRRV